jgi:thiamine biosynthesis lipoprotein
MGTSVSLKAITEISAADFAVVVDEVWRKFGELEQKFSRFRPDSELSQLNTSLGEPFPASTEFFQVVKKALRLAEETGGIFDPTILSSLLAAGYARDFEQLEKIQTRKSSAAEQANFRAIVLNQTEQTITLPKNLALDLGGIVKGYAVDEAAKIFEQHFQNFLVNAGGDIFLRGHNLTGEPWRVGVEHPSAQGRAQNFEPLVTLAVSDRAVATSGSYKRRWQMNGEESHHIIDPRTGKSAASELVSVTIIADSAEMADSLATPIFILGAKAGLAFAKQKKVECLLMTRDLKLLGTPGVEKYVA